MRQPRYTGEARARQVISDLYRKFEYPDQRDFTPQPFIGGGGGAPTIVIAANDASEFSKNKADFVCTGVNDGATIRAASLQMPMGGRILLTEGTFELGSSTILVPDLPITIQGMGHGTILHSTAVTPVFEFIGDGSGIRDLSMVGTSTTAPNIFVKLDNSGWVENVIFDSGAVAIEFQSAGYVIRNCGSHNVPVFVDASAFGSDVIIEGNGFIDAGPSTVDAAPIGRIILGASADNWVIANNNMVGGIEDSNASTNQLVIANNVWETITYIASGHAIIDFSNGDISDATVIGNVVLNGQGNPFLNTFNPPAIIANNIARGVSTGIVATAGAERTVISGNYIEPSQHGISLTDCVTSTVVDNIIAEPGTATDNTYDGIILTGSSDDNLIIGNQIIPAPLGNQPRYGINISSAACDNNAVYANYLGQSSLYGTADSNDAGTGTQVTPAAGAIGGQFAY